MAHISDITSHDKTSPPPSYNFTINPIHLAIVVLEYDMNFECAIKVKDTSAFRDLSAHTTEIRHHPLGHHNLGYIK